MKSLPKILIIAGSDPSGGAGMQTDVKTATAHKVYSSAVPTCLTVQNTQKVQDIFYPDSKILENQLKSLFLDIKFNAIKIGMVGNFANIEVLNSILDRFANEIPIILDPVMIATSGDKLFDLDNMRSFEELVKRSTIVTPNINEAEILAKKKINNQKDIPKIAKIIKDIGISNVFVKAGHFDLDKKNISNILLDENEVIHEITNKRIKTGEIHGTGCALSTAIACNLAKGHNLITSVKKANNYIYKQIKKSKKIGQGSNILTHF